MPAWPTPLQQLTGFKEDLHPEASPAHSAHAGLTSAAPGDWPWADWIEVAFPAADQCRTTAWQRCQPALSASATHSVAPQRPSPPAGKEMPNTSLATLPAPAVRLPYPELTSVGPPPPLLPPAVCRSAAGAAEHLAVRQRHGADSLLLGTRPLPRRHRGPGSCACSPTADLPSYYSLCCTPLLGGVRSPKP